MGGGDSGERRAIDKADGILKLLGGIVLAFALGVGSFALKETYAMRIEVEGLKVTVNGDRAENNRRFGEIKEGIDHLNFKMDRMVEKRGQ